METLRQRGLEVEAQLEPEHREWFSRALRALNGAGVRVMQAGAFGLYHHTGLWRGTKDMDLVILPGDRETAIRALMDAGFEDMYDQEPYDREWIFRAIHGKVIVDSIWQLANKEDQVDEGWFDRSEPSEFFNMPVSVVSAADMCWMKLFVFQAKRCDWPDLINVIRGTRGQLDWEHLLRVVGFHWRLLCALVEIYDWLCPPEREFIPQWFRDELERRRHSNLDANDACRRDLFDSRPWLTSPGAGYYRER